MAKSWSWRLRLPAAVADQASVEVPTPDYDAALADPASAELAVDNDVVSLPDKGTVVFNGDSATVTNLTGSTWPQGDEVYVYVERKGVDAGGAEEALAAMQAQIDANAAAIGALQTDVTDLQARVAALETPVAQSAQAKGK
jgi:hypothetical protein